MRIALALVLVLSACGARASSGVAWPKMAERDNDGGESIAPRPGAAAIAAVASSNDDDDDIKVVSSGTTEAKPAAASEAKAATPGAAAQPDADPIMIEDIVIEIDE